MFTGIIEELGKITGISSYSGFKRIEIKASKVLEDLKFGDSLSVNGVCLTVTGRGPDCFTVEVIKETLKKTNLVKLKGGDELNLERAMKIGGRLGGHVVSGHVDGLAKVVKKRKLKGETYFWLRANLELSRQIIERSSITLEGVSLTAAGIENGLFKVALIPYTLKGTTLGEKRIGDELNLELDYLGKYIQKCLHEIKR